MWCFNFVANAPESDRRDLLSELELMKKLKPHPHVIKLMGCVTVSGKESTDYITEITRIHTAVSLVARTLISYVAVIRTAV